MKKSLLILSMFVWLTLISGLGSQISVAADLQIVNFAVKSGDAALVVLPSGKIMMIDSGTETNFNDVVLPFLTRHGITHVDYWVQSHGHNDHMDGANLVMRFNGMIDEDTIEWNQSGPFEYEDAFTLEGVDFFIYNVRNTSYHGSDANYNSLAFTMTYNGFVYSTGGDEGTKSMQRFVNDHPDKVPAHVRKIAHHGYGPYDQNFLKMTNAAFHVFSNKDWVRDESGFKNDFLPAIQWLANNGGRIDDPGYAITGEVGNIYIRAASDTDWEYSFMPDFANDMMPCWNNSCGPDETPPVITLNDGPNGSADMVVFQYDLFIDPGASANDNSDGSVSVSVVGSVDTNTLGFYTLTYSASDVEGNTATVTRSVEVSEYRDIIAPVITINGASTITIAQNDNYTDAGATASDNDDGDITANIQVSGYVNSSVPGSYVITYDVADAAGNSAIATRIVNVLANTLIPASSLFAPGETISIEYSEGSGNNKDWIGVYPVGSEPAEGDSNAAEANVTIWSYTNGTSGTIDSNWNTVNALGNGDYAAMLFCCDGYNFIGEPAYFSIGTEPDVTAPVISINGGAISVEQFSTFTDPGAIATDDRDDSVNVQVSGIVDINIVGFYSITYTASDTAGNTATATRNVTVTPYVDTVAPVINLNGAGTVSICLGGSYSANVTALDNIDGDLTNNINVSGTVDSNTEGSYSLTYTVSDLAGNTASVLRTVTVTDCTDYIAPVITLNGASSVTLGFGEAYDEQGATASDNIDGDLTANIQTSGIVGSASGTYVINYSVSDAAGNAASTTRSVTVNEAMPSPGAASNLTPADGSTDISISTDLSWTAGTYASSHEVLFGTDPANLAATVQSGTSFNPGALASNTTYYWQINEINASGTTIGSLWSFTTDSFIAGNASTFVSQLVPTAMTPSETVTVSVTMTNAGTTPWTAVSGHKLGSQNAQDNSTWGSNRVALTQDVAPGANHTFTFDVTAPSTASTYNFQWRMVQDGVQWFGATTSNVAINVSAGETVDTILSTSYFESDWDGWIDGDGSASRVKRQLFPTRSEGDYSIKIKDNDGEGSATTSPTYNLSSFDTITLDYQYYPHNQADSDGYLVKYYNGSSWQTIATYRVGSDFQNGQFYSESLTLSSSSYNFPADAKFRFESDGGGGGRHIYIDAVIITASTNGGGTQ